MKIISKFVLEHNPRTRDLELRKKIMNFFKTHKYPVDEEVHKFAKTIGVDKHVVEQEAYSIICDFLCYGKSIENPITYDLEQLKMGIKVEMEHTDCPLISIKIAKDHLSEFSDYYTRLEKMESEAKATKNVTEMNCAASVGNSSYESLPKRAATIRPVFTNIKDKKEVEDESKKLVDEKVKKVAGGYVLKHCHGKDKGKRISATPHPVSKKKAESIHRAIEASKHGSGK
jgi:hypothetical protein